MSAQILLLPGDGIGPEVIDASEQVLRSVEKKFALGLDWDRALIGGAGLDADGVPLPLQTVACARQAQAVLLGAIGGPKWDSMERALRPEQGLLQLRSALGVFANLRPVCLYEELISASSLRPEIVRGLDLVIVRELLGDVYFGMPRGSRVLEDGEREAFNTMVYSESEIRRIAEVAFSLAASRSGRLCSVDKANVLEVSGLWRETLDSLAAKHPQVQLSHMYIDNAAMQLLCDPGQFDVIVTGNLFGDILSDEAAMLSGSIGMLPSASLNVAGTGIYEPCHGSAPEIAGRDIANPLATILSLALLLRHSLHLEPAAIAVEDAVRTVLRTGLRSADIWQHGCRKVGTQEMAAAVAAALSDG